MALLIRHMFESCRSFNSFKSAFIVQKDLGILDCVEGHLTKEENTQQTNNKARSETQYENAEAHLLFEFPSFFLEIAYGFYFFVM